MTDNAFNVRFDYDATVRAFQNDLDDTRKRLFPKAVANMLNRATFDVKRRLDSYTQTAIDRPNKMTAKAWTVVKAKAADGDRMFAEVRAREKQAQYLWFIVHGGTRKPGDVGTNKSKKDIFGFTAKVSDFGGVDRKYIKSLTRKLKTEAKQRGALRTKRAEVVNQNLSPEKQHKKLMKLRWQVAKRGNMGVFIGTVNGVKGLWQRPERLLREERADIVSASRQNRGLFSDKRRGRLNAGRSNASSLSWTKPGQSLKLLVAMEAKTKHKAFFKYDQQVNEAFGLAFTQARFNEAMDYQLQRQRAGSGNP